jgi:hypothetical protein
VDELLEREQELAAAQDVCRRGGGVLVVEGGIGVGKSSLLDVAWLQAAEDGRQILRARGSESTSPTITACVHHNDGELYTDRACGRHDRPLTWNVAGQPGPQGPPGPPGPSGPRGDPGVMDAAQSGGEDPTALGGSVGDSQTFTDAVLTTDAAGNVLAYGPLGLSVDCPSPLPTPDCSYTVGLYVDGQPVPVSAHTVDIPAFTSSDETADLFGVATGVPAGSHHVTIGYRSLLHGPSITDVGSETHSAAFDG